MSKKTIKRNPENIGKAQEALEDLMKKRPRVTPKALKDNQFRVIMTFERQEHNIELVEFEADVDDPQELVGVLCMAIAKTIVMSKNPAMQWPHWIDYTTDFTANCLSQSTHAGLESMGVDYKTVLAYMEKHRDTLKKETVEAFAAIQRAKKQEADKESDSDEPAKIH